MTDTTQNEYAVLPSDPAARKKILDGLQEISNAFTRIEGERDYIKESIKMLAEEYEIKKPVLRKLAKLYHTQSAKDEKSKMDEIFAAFEVLTGEDLDD